MLPNFAITWLFAMWCLKDGATGIAQSYSPTIQDREIFNNSRNSIFDQPYNIEFKYHNHEQMTDFLKNTSMRYQNLTDLYSIGRSVEGRELWVMVVSSSPKEHMIGKPDVKYIGNLHGNEVVGRELLLHLIHSLVTKYENNDPYTTWLLDNTRIHILPSLNPDGFARSQEGCGGSQGRSNFNYQDLNRNFPDYFKQNNKTTQPETEAVKKWLSENQFVVSGSLHGGALVASYPYDNTNKSRHQRGPSVSPDDDVFRHLALTYSRNHSSMHLGAACPTSRRGFENGITNGAEWYPFTGSMQDFNYVWNGCMEITLEISCCKYPPANELPRYWRENRDALVTLLAEAHRGVRGFVIDENGNPIERASVKVKSRDISFFTTKYGEFWRILLPGLYKLEVYANGYAPQEVEFEVVEDHPTLLNVTLHATKNSTNNHDDSAFTDLGRIGLDHVTQASAASSGTDGSALPQNRNVTDAHDARKPVASDPMVFPVTDAHSTNNHDDSAFTGLGTGQDHVTQASAASSETDGSALPQNRTVTGAHDARRPVASDPIVFPDTDAHNTGRPVNHHEADHDPAQDNDSGPIVFPVTDAHSTNNHDDSTFTGLGTGQDHVTQASTASSRTDGSALPQNRNVTGAHDARSPVNDHEAGHYPAQDIGPDSIVFPDN